MTFPTSMGMVNNLEALFQNAGLLPSLPFEPGPTRPTVVRSSNYKYVIYRYIVQGTTYDLYSCYVISKIFTTLTITLVNL